VAEAESPAAEAPAAGTVEGDEELEEAEDLEDKDEEEVDEAGKKKVKKKGKKKGAVEITFDEEKGVYVTRKKRKAGRSKDDPLLNLGDE
jgi:hypothetical protein